MVIDIKMCRFDNVPWGFRLVGGSDFDFPLTVVKVNEGSIAEDAGLKVGDIIVRVNDTAVTPLTHDEVNKIILQCGNVFYFGVQRQESEVDVVSKQFPIIEVERPATPEADSPCKSPLSEHSEDYAHEAAMDELYLPELADRPCSVMSENTEIKLVEEEIAAVLSGESEVLKEHAVLGLFPKPGVCMTSDVLKTLNEEAIKTKAEKDKDSKKWTTFLQKPNRPIPKSPLQIEAERRKANAYQVQIIRARTPERSVSPCVEKPVEPVPEPEPAKEPTPEPEIEEPPPTDSEVPNLEETLPNDANIEEQIEEVPLDAVAAAEENKINKEKKNSQENKSTDEENVYTVEEAGSDNQKKNEPEPIKTEEELALERQLADVQKQLAALASLPSTIQATLDAVTKQLANLLPAIKLQTELQPQKTETEVAHEISLEKIDESQEEVAIKEDVAVTNEVAENKREDMQEPLEGNEQEADDWNDTEVESLDPVKKHDAMIEKAETRQMEEEQNMKKQKRHDVIEELEEHLERKNNPKRSKRAFGPLVPSSERPLVLPGGRRWYRPKDAYNDEFIAETLSAQAELITGTTLGCAFESPLLGYDSRVNFMKYQKPERRIDLNRSEVYKVIHHLDRQPVRGIEVRPPVVPAEADIRKAVHS